MKGVIEKLVTLGLGITYNRVREIQEQVMKQKIKRVDKMDLVCKKNLKRNIFTTAAIDNITTIRLHQLHKITLMGRPFQLFNILQITLIYKYKIADQ